MVPSPRTACACLEDFPIQVRVRDDATLAGAAFAVTSARATGTILDRDRTVAVSPAAREAGVAVGMTSVQALAVCNGLLLLGRDLELDQRATDEVIEALRTVSPTIENGGEGIFFLDARGLRRVHGDERTLARRMVAAVEEIGFERVRAAIAGPRFSAFAAAAYADTPVTVVPAGDERDALAPLPVDLLPLSDENRRRLEQLGVRSIGEFAALPAPAIEVRYGREGVLAHRLACGLGEDLLLRAPEVEVVEETEELAAWTRDLEALRPALERLVERVLARIAPRGALQVVASFLLEDEAIVDVPVEPAAPCADARTLRTLLELEIARATFSAPVVEASLRVAADAPRMKEQGRLFASRRRDPGRVQRVLARLAALFGARALQRTSVRDSHRPEARTVRETFSSTGGGAADERRLPPRPVGDAARSGDLVSALRLIDPPRAVRTWHRDGKLTAFALDPRRRDSILTVRLLFGPHRRSGEWWDEPFARDYYEAATADRGLYWLFREGRTGRWYLHGVFD